MTIILTKGVSMDMLQLLGLIGGNAAILIPLWLWNRSESNADRRDMMNLMINIQSEIKDFHGRLCAIEERRLKERI